MCLDLIYMDLLLKEILNVHDNEDRIIYVSNTFLHQIIFSYIDISLNFNFDLTFDSEQLCDLIDNFTVSWTLGLALHRLQTLNPDMFKI